MKQLKFFLPAFILLTNITCTNCGPGEPRSNDPLIKIQPASGEDLLLWYKEPVFTFDDGCKIGNGRLGATVLDGFEEERIGLNHAWLWRKWKLGGLRNPKAAHHLPAIRQLFFEGKLIEGGEAANLLMCSQKITKADILDDPEEKRKYHNYGPDPFQPAGDLNIVFLGHKFVTDYRRSDHYLTERTGYNSYCKVRNRIYYIPCGCYSIPTGTGCHNMCASSSTKQTCYDTCHIRAT